MISIIVCSIKPHLLEQFKNSVEETIGMEYEIVALDNRQNNYSITKCYNLGASKARGEYLCFVHEDVIFSSKDWGRILVEKMKDQSTGVIGFAGAIVKTKTLSGWSVSRDYNRLHFHESLDAKNNQAKFNLYNPDNLDFSPVVTLDGFCLAMRAKVWQKHQFDEHILDGFHLYDLDISTSVFVAGLKNYVCNTIDITHLSRGAFNKQWFEYSSIYHDKWADFLPLSVEGVSPQEIEMLENKVFGNMTYFLLKKNVGNPKYHKERLAAFIRKNPKKFKSYYLYYRYLRYLVTQ